ncbi:MAG TPA: two-component system response regulator [Gammaproteobacteria bacterium]|nr:two-component system response regulator [Gammaproteobacteria bacterium]
MLSKEEKILIVDDMRMIRKSITKILGEIGYDNVIFAENGEQAVTKHREEKPGMIFLDVVMPKMTGDEALELIREADANVPIVMLTSVADKTLMDKCQRLGISGYVLKPVTQDNGPDLLFNYLANA